MKPYTYFIFHKPFRVLCQFSKEGSEKKTLADFLDLPTDVYPFGRLDEDSEGLLLLSSERSLMNQYSSSKTEKEYWVQVEGSIEKVSLLQLVQGLNISIKGKKHFLKAKSASLNESVRDMVPGRNPPIRYRKNVPDSWISITLTEGKNRQIRRMTAAVGHPTLRLIRQRIGLITLDGLAAGEYKQLSRNEFLQAMKT